MKLSSLTLGLAAALFLAVCATPSFAESFYLNASTPATGSELDINPLTVSAGTITFSGEIDDQIDPDMIASGASGNNFDVHHYSLPNGSTASLSWDFDAYWVSFIYGGNGAGITITAFDEFGNIVDTFTEPNTYGSSAGPMMFDGGSTPRIRRLEWFDTGGNSFAALDNITISLTPNPEPGTLGLMALAAIGVAVVRRRRRKQS
jgi:hypothetical protein